MQLNPLSLSFSKDQNELEALYRENYFYKNLKIFRLCHFFSIFFYGIIAFLDYRLFKDQFAVLMFVRFGVVIPVFIAGFFTTFHRSYKYFWPILNNFYVVLTGAGFIFIIAYCPPPLSYSYYVGVIICFFFGYTFIRSPFLMASIAGSFLFIAFTIVSIIIDTPENILIRNTFFMLCVNVLGMIICYTTDLYMRRDFYLSTILKNERQVIEDTNERLENIVAERTEELSLSNQQLKEEIIERKELEARLVQAQKLEAIGKLAGGIAHGFNNILFPIIGYSELLMDEFRYNTELKDSLEKIHNGAMRAGDLVKQMLIFSRQETNLSELFEIQPVVEKALKLLTISMPSSIKIEQDIEKDCGTIKGDPSQIHQIVLHLTTNAYHAMEETGGTLKVSLAKKEFYKNTLITPDMSPGTYVRLMVSDSGTGMPEEVEKKIFDPFFTTKEPDKGTGMGLSVVHGIVEKCGGIIQVITKPNSGTKITILLPLEDVAIEEKPIQEKGDTQKGVGHILIVDDEELIVTLEKTWLERLGYKVTALNSSPEALNVFSKTPEAFDLVVTDMSMPGINGQELSSELNRLRPDLPILMCTGFSDELSTEEAESMGIKGYLFKPVVMKDFADKIEELLLTTRKG